VSDGRRKSHLLTLQRTETFIRFLISLRGEDRYKKKKFNFLSFSSSFNLSGSPLLLAKKNNNRILPQGKGKLGNFCIVFLKSQEL